VLGQKPTQRDPAGTTRAARSIEPDLEVGRLRASKLFEKWKQGDLSERDLIHVHSLLGIFDHTPTAVRARAMKQLEDAAAHTADDEAVRFLQDIRKAFPQALIR
jgi:hypothetical protein